MQEVSQVPWSSQKETDCCIPTGPTHYSCAAWKRRPFLSLSFSEGKRQWDAGGLEDLLLFQLPQQSSRTQQMWSSPLHAVHFRSQPKLPNFYQIWGRGGSFPILQGVPPQLALAPAAVGTELRCPGELTARQLGCCDRVPPRSLCDCSLALGIKRVLLPGLPVLYWVFKRCVLNGDQNKSLLSAQYVSEWFIL